MKMRFLILCLLSAGMMWLPGVQQASTAFTASAAAPGKHIVKGTVSDITGPLIGASVKEV